jgi:hypothetical protein
VGGSSAGVMWRLDEGTDLFTTLHRKLLCPRLNNEGAGTGAFPAKAGPTKSSPQQHPRQLKKNPPNGGLLFSMRLHDVKR